MLRWSAVLLWAGMIFALSSLPSLQSPFAPAYDFVLRQLAHIGEFTVLTVLLWWAFQMYTGRRVQAWLLAVLAAVLYSVSDEWHQTFIAGRYGALRDVGFDALGIVGSYVLVQHLPFHAVGIFERMLARGLCPACLGRRVYRSRRRGVVEWFSRLIRLAPFRCGTCRHRFWRFTLRGL
jgi:VanZ family protein